MAWLTPFIVLITVIISIWLWIMARPRHRCPQCDSYRIGLITKEPKTMRTVDMDTSGIGGGTTIVQTMYEATYQCDECRHRWMVSLTETT